MWKYIILLIIYVILVFKEQNMAVEKKTLTQLSVPICLETLFYMLSGMVDTLMLSSVSDQAVGAVGTANTYIGVFIIMFGVISSGMVAVMSQNIGAGKRQRANETLRYAVMITVGFGIIVGIFMQFFASPVVALFTDASDASGAEVVRLGGQYLRGYVWDCMFAGIHFSFSGYFCACGLSNIPFMNNFISILAVRIPVAYMASKFFTASLFPMGLASPLGSLLSVFISVIAYMWLKQHPEKVMLNI